ncbi:MAG: glucan biosynthesis protein [Pseudomonadota bacterium]
MSSVGISLMPLERRRVLIGAARLGAMIASSALGALAARADVGAPPELFGEAEPFSRPGLVAMAQALSREPFEDRRGLVAQPLQDLSQEGYGAMRHGVGFPLPLSEHRRFFADPLLAGFVFSQPVDLYLVEGESARKLAFSREMFVFDPPADEEVPEDVAIPFSGLRLRCEINTPGIFDEFAVFQGASYFRAVGAGEVYGLSARGLAIDTGAPTGEEFPFFRALYVERPAAGAIAVVVHALLDSPSTTGAYRITVRPGEATITDVELTLFPRRELTTVGFAPFSSMFLFDGINRDAFSDHRHAAHDSDGLYIHTGAGEWLWRPLGNPERLEVSAFVDTTPRGFGLVQRKRRYEDFLDAHAAFERRPTAWVEPIGDWGAGAVVLFEIPTQSEANDNIVAYWQPDRPILAGEPFDLTYRIHWDAAPPVEAQGARVVATRVGKSGVGEHERFVIDYDLRGADASQVNAQVETSVGKVRDLTHYPTPQDGILQVSFELDPDAHQSAELRLTLDIDGAPPPERWLYRWTA